jgi:hypothetical protein
VIVESGFFSWFMRGAVSCIRSRALRFAGLAAVTVAKFKEKLFRLFEQAWRATASAWSGRLRGTEPSTSASIVTHINNYEHRCLSWTRGD